MIRENTDFFSLITNIIKCNEEYLQARKKYQNLNYSFFRFSKGNKTDIDKAKSELETSEKQIYELILELDGIPREYYDLVNEKIELLNKYWYFQTKVGFINSRFLWDNICDKTSEIEINEMKLIRKRTKLMKHNKLIKYKINQIDKQIQNLQFNII